MILGEKCAEDWASNKFLVLRNMTGINKPTGTGLVIYESLGDI